ncbi:MAG: hypothetical protein GX996_02280, partial [Firmicutes bacterium]|nr:hypothetical protein [Bacillota bacterium]
MKRRDYVIMLLCMLILSNMATYSFTRSFFSTSTLEVYRDRGEAGLFWEVWDILENKYFRPVDKEQMIRGALKGMLQSLEDPHTAYLSPESM